MKKACFALLALSLFVGAGRSEEKVKTAPKIVLKSPDGNTSIDLEKLTSEGPVLVRFDLRCLGCDQELAYFKKLQAGYNGKGLKTIAVFREKPDVASNYAKKQGLEFYWLSDPKGDMWKTFDAKAMPTNILFDKGGKVVKVVPGCTNDGKNAQTISAEVAKLLKTSEVVVREAKK